MYQLKLSHYMLYLVLSVVAHLVLISYLPALLISDQNQALPRTMAIIWHNLVNYVRWTIGFWLSPFYLVVETVYTAWTIKAGITSYGLNGTIARLFRHGLIEFPINCLYQFLALRMLYLWWRDKGLSIIKQYFLDNTKVHILVIVGIIIAGLLEGMT